MAECAGAVPPIDILNFACQTPEERVGAKSTLSFLGKLYFQSQGLILSIIWLSCARNKLELSQGH